VHRQRTRRQQQLAPDLVADPGIGDRRSDEPAASGEMSVARPIETPPCAITFIGIGSGKRYSRRRKPDARSAKRIASAAIPSVSPAQIRFATSAPVGRPLPREYR